MNGPPFPAPYVGLRPFERHESLLFFGREEQVDQLLDKLGEIHFLAVLGLSGSGKSSLVRAGLLPALEAGGLAQDALLWADLRPDGRQLAAVGRESTVSLHDLAPDPAPPRRGPRPTPTPASAGWRCP